jgi:hypothetical protein
MEKQMKKFLLSTAALAALNLTLLTSPTVVNPAPLSTPQAADVNRFRYTLNEYERQGEFRKVIHSDSPPPQCADEFREVKLEGNVLVVIIDPCLANFLVENHKTDYHVNSAFSNGGEYLLKRINELWKNNPDNRLPNSFYNKYNNFVKLRVYGSGSFGVIDADNHFYPPGYHPLAGKAYLPTK